MSDVHHGPARATHGTCVVQATHGTCVVQATHGTCVVQATHGTCVVQVTHGTCGAGDAWHLCGAWHLTVDAWHLCGVGECQARACPWDVRARTCLLTDTCVHVKGLALYPVVHLYSCDPLILPGPRMITFIDLRVLRGCKDPGYKPMFANFRILRLHSSPACLVR